ncbi:MAG TPA: hypothetical protein DEU95_15660, partial [Chloroflexi bacterium]|nr:hypothetical protein [Chloroflexota bacterium]
MNSIERRTIRHLLSVSATMLVPFVLIGALIAGWRGAALGIAIGFAIQTLAWALAQPLLLKMMRADVVDMTSHPVLLETVTRLAESAGVARPVVAVSRIRTPNAFAAATPGGGIVGVTTGLLELLPEDQVAAVLAHEIAHLERRDRTSVTIAALLGSIPGVMAAASGSDLLYDRAFRRRIPRAWGGRHLRPVRDAIAFASMPFTALLVRASAEPGDEFHADAEAARLIGDPQPLIAALRKIGALAGRVP